MVCGPRPLCCLQDLHTHCWCLQLYVMPCWPSHAQPAGKALITPAPAPLIWPSLPSPSHAPARPSCMCFSCVFLFTEQGGLPLEGDPQHGLQPGQPTSASQGGPRCGDGRVEKDLQHLSQALNRGPFCVGCISSMGLCLTSSQHAGLPTQPMAVVEAVCVAGCLSVQVCVVADGLGAIVGCSVFGIV